MQAVLARIDAVNPRVNAYVTVAREAALYAARAATNALTRGAALPPLYGVPVSIKDLTPTKGIRTTWGSKIFEYHVPEEDALIVQRLKAAGAIVVGAAMIVEVKYQPPYWLHAVLWLPLILVTTLLPLRAMKSLLIARCIVSPGSG